MILQLPEAAILLPARQTAFSRPPKGATVRGHLWTCQRKQRK